MPGKEYDYNYEGGLLKSAVECDITLGDYGNAISRTPVNTIRYSYDKDGNLVKKHISITGQTVCYEYPEGGNPVAHRYIGMNQITSHSKNDSFGRKVFDEIQLGKGFVSRQFMYHAGEVTDEHKDNSKVKSSPVCHLVSQIVLSDERTISYEYDNEERITKVVDSVDGTTEYTYDALGQLLTETVNGVVVNTMTYDNYGNILTKNGVAYTYGNAKWKDLLTKVGDSTITYDTQGNPLSYMGSLMEWEKGRQLKKLTKADGSVLEFTYNANGIRTSKTVDSVKHTYTLDGAKIICETWPEGEGTRQLIPLYDNEDNVCGVRYWNVSYFFLKNQQGDVIAITDPNGEVVAKYCYDAWGKVLSVTDKNGNPVTLPNNIANVNPFRYRGYYYDRETGLYYLQSRYYDPETGRFLNADEAETLFLKARCASTINSFAYVKNTPVSLSDYSGYIATNIISGIVGALLNVFIDFLTSALSYWSKSKFSFKGFKYNLFSWGTALAAATGFAAGLIISSKYSKWISAVGGGLISGVTNIINCIIKNTPFSTKDILIDIGFGLIWGYFGGNGVGRAYFQKNLFGKGGYFVYKGVRYYASRSLQLIKPVIKDFAKAFAIYMGTQITDWLQKFVRGKV